MTVAARLITTLLAGAACSFISQASLAQDEAPDSLEIQNKSETGAQGDETAIIVTGSRIRGAEIAGDIITLDSEAIIAAGQIDLGEALRSLPQNFGGGQNPGVGFGAGRPNSNLNSA